MARIRSIKPSFFRHEGLQELELAHPGQYPMFVFSGLWGHCDKLGRFEWKPRTLKLDILPFLPFEMAATLKILEDAGFLRRYVVGGGVYGHIPTFTAHQRINGKEASAPPEFPDPPNEVLHQKEVLGKQSGSSGEAVETTGREGKGRGREEEGNRNNESRAAMSVDDVMTLWNSFPELVQAKSVTGPIGTSVQRRIKEHPDLEWFRTLFDRVARSDYLTGKKNDFAATLDWVLGPKNLAKIMNGNYDNRASPRKFDMEAWAKEQEGRA